MCSQRLSLLCGVRIWKSRRVNTSRQWGSVALATSQVRLPAERNGLRSNGVSFTQEVNLIPFPKDAA